MFKLPQAWFFNKTIWYGKDFSVIEGQISG